MTTSTPDVNEYGTAPIHKIAFLNRQETLFGNDATVVTAGEEAVPIETLADNALNEAPVPAEVDDDAEVEEAHVSMSMSKDDLVDAAVAAGYDRDEASGMTKQDIVDALS